MSILLNALAEYQKALVCAWLFLLGVSALFLPLIRYLLRGFPLKRKDVMDGLSGEACAEYFSRFGGRDGLAPATARQAFEQLYDKGYGRGYYVVPFILFGATGATAVLMTVWSGLHHLGYLNNPIFDLPKIALSAIAGAYLWVLNDHISRARRRDFSPSDVLWATLRLIVAIPMGYTVAALAGKDFGPFVAFAMGAFPLSDLLSLMRSLAEKKFDIKSDQSVDPGGTIHLQGVNKQIAERLDDEDLGTILQVAYCDPVQVVMRSNLPFLVVTDYISQALAWTYLEDDLAKVRKFGLRGAIEITDFLYTYQDASAAGHADVVAALPVIAAELKQNSQVLLFVFQQIAGDPYAIFLCKIWV